MTSGVFLGCPGGPACSCREMAVYRAGVIVGNNTRESSTGGVTWRLVVAGVMEVRKAAIASSAAAQLRKADSAKSVRKTVNQNDSSCLTGYSAMWLTQPRSSDDVATIAVEVPRAYQDDKSA